MVPPGPGSPGSRGEGLVVVVKLVGLLGRLGSASASLDREALVENSGWEGLILLYYPPFRAIVSWTLRPTLIPTSGQGGSCLPHRK